MKDAGEPIAGSGSVVRDGPDAVTVSFSSGRQLAMASVTLAVVALLALFVLSFPMELRTVDWWPVQWLGYLACAAGVVVLLAWVAAEAWLLVEYGTTVTIAVAPSGIIITRRSPLGARERQVAPGEVRSVAMDRASASEAWIRYSVALHPLTGKRIRICESVPAREAQLVYNLLLAACGRPLDLDRQGELEREWKATCVAMREEVEESDLGKRSCNRRSPGRRPKRST